MKAIKRTVIVLLTGGMLSGAVIAFAQASQRPQNPAPSPDAAGAYESRYAILTRNNIFVRDRRPAPPAGRVATTRQAPEVPPAPEKDWVLIGVVFEDGQFRAYFENLRGGPTTRAVVGDPIAAGFIDQVFLDAVAYQGNGQRIWVDIGQDLTGAAPSSAAASRSRDEDDEEGDESATAEGESPPDGEETRSITLSIEEVMRRRRQQESGGPGAPD